MTLKRVRDSGIHGFVDKRDQTVQRLKEAIDLISRGHEFFSPVVNEVIGPLRHLRVEVVHEHAQSRFLGPATTRELGAAGGSYEAGAVQF